MSQGYDIESLEEKQDGRLVRPIPLDPCYGLRYRTLHNTGKTTFHFKPLIDGRSPEIIEEERQEVLKTIVHKYLSGVPFWMVICQGISPTEIVVKKQDVSMSEDFKPRYELPYDRLKASFLRDISNFQSQRAGQLRDKYNGYAVDYYCDIEYVICALSSLTQNTKYHDNFHRAYEHHRISKVEKGNRNQVLLEYERGRFQTLVSSGIADWSGVLVWLMFFSWYTVDDTVDDWQYARGQKGKLRKSGAIKKRREQLFNPFTAGKIFETYFMARMSAAEQIDSAREYDRDLYERDSEDDN
jgi:hypothetical protein